MESKPSDLANGGQISWSPNLQIWQTEIGYYGVQTFRFGKRRSVMESKPSDLANGDRLWSPNLQIWQSVIWLRPNLKVWTPKKLRIWLRPNLKVWIPKNSLSLFTLFLNVWKYLVKISKQSFVIFFVTILFLDKSIWDFR